MISKPLLKAPLWLVKAEWDATASYFKVYARNEAAAWETAWKQVAKRFGGDSCLRVIVKRRLE